jgi:hypothetical protein
MQSAKSSFFQISLVPDVMGELIDHPLHLSVHPHEWWVSKFESLGFNVAWAEPQGVSSLFYVTR